MKQYLRRISFIVLGCFFLLTSVALPSPPRFKVLVLFENKGHHIAYSTAATQWLNKLAIDSSFAIDYINNTDAIDDNCLKKYQLFIQLDYPPYGWKSKAVAAFQQYVEEGSGGWIAFHHATLLGEFDGYPTWQWFFNFMGGIRFTNYIPDFADGTVHVEDALHACMKNVPEKFTISKEEWYSYDKSPRQNVHVIASVDESTYAPSSPVKMGDHPVIWTNTNYACKNIYIFMGHSPELFKDKTYTTIFSNSIFWAAGQTRN